MGGLAVDPILMAILLGAALVTLFNTPGEAFLSATEPADKLFFRFMIKAPELLLVELLRLGPAVSLLSSSSSSSSRRRFSASRSGGVWLGGDAGTSVEVSVGLATGC